ncbi:MAG: sodium-dependent bicarbonate transport family permease [Beijerinckiaceae bacterium]|nr:sodium-dependent bicarbonate transport family permease [Beijerinckiaceae bacterium]
MDASLFKALIDPAILFFFFGLFAGFVRSNLAIPEQIAKFLSLYLLVAVGYKGGVGMSQAGFSTTMALALTAALILAFVIPVYAFALLRRRLNPFDAAAVAATYGSVSAVTFITAAAFIERQGVPYGGYMAVALVLMESPAIIMAVLLANVVRAQAAASGSASAVQVSLKTVLHEAFTDGAHLLLLGALVIGYLTGAPGKAALDPFLTSIQKGMLLFFLLEMGLLVARRAKDIQFQGPFLIVFAIVLPLVNAVFATGLAYLFKLPLGDAFLLAVLAASASYIVVPAVVRYAIPEANASLYFGMSLAMTFPFNILIGIPLYYTVLKSIWG